LVSYLFLLDDLHDIDYYDRINIKLNNTLKQWSFYRMTRLFNTDCEGPISKNDNAFELAQRFMPQGDKFFSKISKYDDILADIDQKKGYKAGDTLKLILPFFKAYDITEADIINFSSKNILIVPEADFALQFIDNIMPAFIISTSYCPYINALCNAINFPVDKTFCTELSIDNYILPKSEVSYLKELYNEILALPDIEISSSAKSRSDLNDETIKCVERLDQIFWNELSQMVSGKMLVDINPVGGFEKANAIKESCKITGLELSKVMYVGDSITDTEAMKLTSKSGGISISFNGNRYAIQSSDIACMSPNALILAGLAYRFNEYGTDAIKELAMDWDKLKHEFEGDIQKIIPRFSVKEIDLCLINETNINDLISKSENFRKTIRGESIGRLG
jgi:predicted HAD superfamily phosphohydrolase